MLVNHFSPQLDGIQLSFVQFFVVSVLSTIFAFVFEAPSPDQFRAAAVSIAYCGIMSSGVAYTLQIVGQKERYSPTTLAATQHHSLTPGRLPRKTPATGTSTT